MPSSRAPVDFLDPEIQRTAETAARREIRARLLRKRRRRRGQRVDQRDAGALLAAPSGPASADRRDRRCPSCAASARRRAESPSPTWRDPPADGTPRGATISRRGAPRRPASCVIADGQIGGQLAVDRQRCCRPRDALRPGRRAVLEPARTTSVAAAGGAPAAVMARSIARDGVARRRVPPAERVDVVTSGCRSPGFSSVSLSGLPRLVLSRCGEAASGTRRAP